MDLIKKKEIDQNVKVKNVLTLISTELVDFDSELLLIK